MEEGERREWLLLRGVSLTLQSTIDACAKQSRDVLAWMEWSWWLFMDHALRLNPEVKICSRILAF